MDTHEQVWIPPGPGRSWEDPTKELPLETDPEHPTPRNDDVVAPVEENAQAAPQESEAASPPPEEFDEDPSRNPDGPMKDLKGG